MDEYSKSKSIQMHSQLAYDFENLVKKAKSLITEVSYVEEHNQGIKDFEFV